MHPSFQALHMKHMITFCDQNFRIIQAFQANGALLCTGRKGLSESFQLGLVQFGSPIQVDNIDNHDEEKEDSWRVGKCGEAVCEEKSAVQEDFLYGVMILPVRLFQRTALWGFFWGEVLVRMGQVAYHAGYADHPQHGAKGTQENQGVQGAYLHHPLEEWLHMFFIMLLQYPHGHHEGAGNAEGEEGNFDVLVIIMEAHNTIQDQKTHAQDTQEPVEEQKDMGGGLIHSPAKVHNDDEDPCHHYHMWQDGRFFLQDDVGVGWELDNH